MMNKEHHVIIVRGLGDHNPMQAQWNFVIKLWSHLGLKAHIYTPGWADGKNFAPKLKELTERVNYLTNQGFLVSLVGISAGASAAINTYVANKDKIHKLVFICGKVRHPENVNPQYFEKNPAFKDSIYLSEANSHKLSTADKKKMLYIHSLADRIVPSHSNKLEGVQTRAVLAFGHILGITVALTFYSQSIGRFLKQ